MACTGRLHQLQRVLVGHRVDVDVAGGVTRQLFANRMPKFCKTMLSQLERGVFRMRIQNFVSTSCCTGQSVGHGMLALQKGPNWHRDFIGSDLLAGHAFIGCRYRFVLLDQIQLTFFFHEGVFQQWPRNRFEPCDELLDKCVSGHGDLLRSIACIAFHHTGCQANALHDVPFRSCWTEAKAISTSHALMQNTVETCSFVVQHLQISADVAKDVVVRQRTVICDLPGEVAQIDQNDGKCYGQFCHGAGWPLLGLLLWGLFDLLQHVSLHDACCPEVILQLVAFVEEVTLHAAREEACSLTCFSRAIGCNLAIGTFCSALFQGDSSPSITILVLVLGVGFSFAFLLFQYLEIPSV
mmetsp:Transcript_1171/g.2615  ORF Transcript_1171/g.2615 Transcript_1171/m.2615 type:complete len:353 (+) Transcript_1171:859-1917(+)